MSLLFLDPLALALLLGLLAYVWLVWRGTVRRWFGRGEAWTVLAWPIPLLAILVPPVAGGVVWLAGQLGMEVGGGGLADAVLYAAAYLVPAAGLAVWPPRWSLPTWARERLTSLPRDGDPDAPPGAMPAVQGGRGHGSRARWVWRVDGVAGHVWVDGEHLRFRALRATEHGARLDVDDEAVAELRFSSGDELRLEPPRGGWWSRGHADVVLAEVDQVRCRAVVAWRRDGLIALEVAGRRPLRLWVDDVRRLERMLVDPGDDPAPGHRGSGVGSP
jgi:hypothetical protein